ncbi:hypothetical protein [Cellulomonas hominis]|uniref:hypothetical protein n=1 Tax=Cellulomonas hominis TaxID=156981 RepID=UPI001B94BE0B|nr:hypothetical protein [Cellulomonas hominis]VTR76637.1 hypothetical protein CHMI_01399 [Cellulomonas hominis]
MATNMMRDGDGGQQPLTTPLLSTGQYTVDIDQLRSVANSVLGLADRVQAVGTRRSMHAAAAYGSPLATAGQQWADRYAYLLDGIAEDVEHAGHELRGSADTYLEVELSVEARAKGIQRQMDSAW